MNFALVSVLIPAIVALIVSMISPVFTHLIWRRQKRKEEQLVVAEHFAVLNAEIESHLHRYCKDHYIRHIFLPIA